MEISFQGHQLKNLKSDDVKILLNWKNQKINSLLPDHPLKSKEEDEFLTSIKANLAWPSLESIHLRLDIADELIGIAGFTEISWQAGNAKTYFFLDPNKTSRSRPVWEIFKYCPKFLMKCAFNSVGLNKIAIETPSSEIMLVHTIEASGFKREAEFKDYAQLNGRNVSMIYASCTKDDYFRVFPNP